MSESPSLSDRLLTRTPQDGLGSEVTALEPGQAPDEAAAEPEVLYQGNWLAVSWEQFRDYRQAAAATPGSRAHALRHHQPRTIAQQATRAEQAPEGTYEAWHQRWVAGPGTRASVAIDWVTHDGRHFWGAVALIASALAVLVAAIHLAL